MDIDDDVAQWVWWETRSLVPKDGTKEPLTRLYAVIANLLKPMKSDGLLWKLGSPPIPKSPDAVLAFDAIKAALVAYQANGEGLPARAALIHVPFTGETLPQEVQWVLEGSASSRYVFAAKNKEYRLFESPHAPAEGTLSFVSTVTGDGINPPQPLPRFRRLAWLIGLTFALMFLCGATLALLTGHTLSEAKGTLLSAAPKLQQQLLTNTADICAADIKTFPAGRTPGTLCDLLLDENGGSSPEKMKSSATAQKVLQVAAACTSKPNSEGCNTLWRAVLKGGNAEVPIEGSTSIIAAYLMLLAGIGGVIIALGLGTKQRVAGVWIDQRNRVSLARAQVTLWTTVVLAGYANFALFNIGFGGAGEALLMCSDNPDCSVFPSIPASVAAALGIATTSSMISALILPTKANRALALAAGDPAPGQRGLPFLGARSDGLATNSSPAAASIADIFMGEEKANADFVDVARLQNVVITVILVLSYFAVLLQMSGTIPGHLLLGRQTMVFANLPDLGTTFTSLLFVSHATYLVAKAHDASETS